jgi:ABC-type amino acid transport system permease subunit
MDMTRAKADLSVVADVLAVLSAVAVVGVWLRQGDHWRPALVVVGIFGWCYLLGSACLAIRQAKIYWTYDWAYNHFAVGAIFAVVVVLACLIAASITAVLLGVQTALTYVGLLLALAAGALGLNLLAQRYRQT